MYRRHKSIRDRISRLLWILKQVTSTFSYRAQTSARRKRRRREGAVLRRLYLGLRLCRCLLCGAVGRQHQYSRRVTSALDLHYVHRSPGGGDAERECRRKRERRKINELPGAVHCQSISTVKAPGRTASRAGRPHRKHILIHFSTIYGKLILNIQGESAPFFGEISI